MLRVTATSLGSVWEIDLANSRYRRINRRERPRADPSWGDENAGPLQDVVWHPMVGEPWLVHAPGYTKWGQWMEGALRIPIASERPTMFGFKPYVHAPLEKDEFERLQEIFGAPTP